MIEAEGRARVTGQARRLAGLGLGAGRHGDDLAPPSHPAALWLVAIREENGSHSCLRDPVHAAIGSVLAGAVAPSA